MIFILASFIHLFTNEYFESPGGDTGFCMVCDKPKGKCSRLSGVGQFMKLISMLLPKQPPTDQNKKEQGE